MRSAAEAAQPSDDLVGPLHRGAADHDSLDAIAQQILDDRRRDRTPPPTCSLDGPAAKRDATMTARFAKHTVPRAVEIHDVQPGRAECAVSLQQLVRLSSRSASRRAKSPWYRRTQRPLRRSIAGINSMS